MEFWWTWDMATTSKDVYRDGVSDASLEIGICREFTNSRIHDFFFCFSWLFS